MWLGRIIRARAFPSNCMCPQEDASRRARFARKSLKRWATRNLVREVEMMRINNKLKLRLPNAEVPAARGGGGAAVLFGADVEPRSHRWRRRRNRHFTS